MVEIMTDDEESKKKIEKKLKIPTNMNEYNN